MKIFMGLRNMWGGRTLIQSKQVRRQWSRKVTVVQTSPWLESDRRLRGREQRCYKVNCASLKGGKYHSYQRYPKICFHNMRFKLLMFVMMSLNLNIINHFEKLKHSGHILQNVLISIYVSFTNKNFSKRIPK